MSFILYSFIDAFEDSVKMLPFLFIAFLIIEVVEHYSAPLLNRLLSDRSHSGPLVGALAGCIPQCGFSVLASNLYAGGIIGCGTLLSVFLSTSDEAILIIMGHPDQGVTIIKLLLYKIFIALIAGYLIHFLIHIFKKEDHHPDDLCSDCGCHEHGGIVYPAVKHTVKIFLLLLLSMFLINVAIEWIGLNHISDLLLEDSIFQPFIAALVGLIPNCAISVLLTELYMKGILSFASVIAGLCAGGGAGLIVLFEVNRNWKENCGIIGLLYIISALAGLLVSIIS